jgi:hypothetical protein
MSEFHLSFEELLYARIHRMVREYPPVGYRSLIGMPNLDVGSLQDGEKLIGLYENSAEDIRQNLIITSKGLRLFTNDWRFLSYGQIRRAGVRLERPEDKQTADTLILELKSGEELGVKISGGRGRFRDIWQIDRFLMRVIDGYQERYED